MRIVCPRCVAQYEVDESAIPETGREVQCANCENIWFQDYIEMLPDRPVDLEDGDETGNEVFDDLDGKSDASFHSSRSASPDSGDDLADETFEAEDEPADILAQDDPFEDDDEDDEPSPSVAIPPLADDVRDVLRSEAAFSSARAQLDDAAANALDGDGAERILAQTETHDPDALNPAVEPEPQAPDLDDLTAFLDAHDESQEITAEELEESQDVELDSAEIEDSESDFDPLADLDAIRSQLKDMATKDQPEYTPNLPADDPLPDLEPAVETVAPAESGETEDELSDAATNDVSEETVEQSDIEFDATAFAAALAGASDPEPETGSADTDVDSDASEQVIDQVEPEDDFDQEKPRHAYRADGGTQEPEPQDTAPQSEADKELADALSALAELGENSDSIEMPDDLGNELMSEDASPEPEPEPEPEQMEQQQEEVATPSRPVGAAAAAMGLTRPRGSGNRARVRTIPGFEIEPRPADQEPQSKSAGTHGAGEISSSGRPAAEIEPVPERKPDPSRRPKEERKALLPDVEELDASLRGEAEEPRRRDREMMNEHNEEMQRAAGGSFRRAFVWTVFIIALLLALYVMRPAIVSAFPPAGYVLNPYAALIDGIRIMIDGLFGG